MVGITQYLQKSVCQHIVESKIYLSPVTFCKTKDIYNFETYNFITSQLQTDGAFLYVVVEGGMLVFYGSN